MIRIVIFLLGCSMLLGQETGVIRGVVTDDAGTPIEEAMVGLTGPSRSRLKTGADGRFEFSGLPPAAYSLSARKGRSFERRRITLGAGESLQVNLEIGRLAGIRGRVVDDQEEPMAGVRVELVGTEYRHGEVRHTFRSVANTDDLGEFLLERARPGVRYAIRAKLVPESQDAISDAPGDPELRRPAFRPTYYPSSTDVAGAERMIFRVGEVREGVEIRMERAESFCISGVTQSGGAARAAMFYLEPRWPISGLYGPGSGTYLRTPQRRTGPDGRFRVCDLAPDEYRITVFTPAEGDFTHFGLVDVALVDRDLEEVQVVAGPARPLPGEIVWADEAPAEPIEDEVNLFLFPTDRVSYGDERNGRSSTSQIPGDFVFPGVWLGEYELAVRGLPDGIYLSDVRYDGRSIRHGSLNFGSAPDGSRLRIVLAHDPGYARFTVSDSDGDPAPDAYVYLIPDGVFGPADVAARMRELRGDQYGVYLSDEQPPDVYQAVAMPMKITPAPEDIALLNAARPTAPEVELVAGETTELDLELSR